MRFLILTQYYPPEVGAAQVRLAAFARELRRAGHEVEVVTALPNYPGGSLQPADRGRLSRRETIDGIHVTRLWLLTATGAGMRRLLSYLSFTITGLVGALRARRPDVVFVESPPLFLGAAGWLAARRSGAAFVLNVSDLWPDSVRDMGLMRRGPWLGLAERLERWLYRHATAVTAVTDGIRDRLIAAKGVEARRVLFLPNGADTETFRPIPAPVTASPPARPVFLYVGTHGHAHALSVVIDAAELVPEADFVLAGDGSDKARLEAEAGRRALPNLRLEPPMAVTDVAARYSNAVAGLSTIRRSDFMAGVRPAKVLAIMACGRPVVYSGFGEGADLVRAADAGVIAEPEDAPALARAARAILSDPVRAEEMGANGRRYVEQHFAWPRLVTEWLGELEVVLRRDRFDE